MKDRILAVIYTAGAIGTGVPLLVGLWHWLTVGTPTPGSCSPPSLPDNLLAMTILIVATVAQVHLSMQLAQRADDIR